jgi:hypothetical protein
MSSRFFYEKLTEYYVFLLHDDIFSSIFGKMSFIFGLSVAEMLPDVEFFVMFVSRKVLSLKMFEDSDEN